MSFRDRALRAAGLACTAAVLGLLALLLARVAASGAGALSLALLWEPARDAGRAGGLGPVLLSTAGVLAVALAVAVPAGLATAIWLSEYAGPGARAVRAALDVLASVPSIVYGLYGLAVFCEQLGLGWSLLSGGLTAAIMVLPLFVRLAEEALRAVPDDWRRAAAALGLERWQILARVILPAAAPALASALVLSVGRVLAESAALLFTAGSSLRAPASLLDPGRVLALHVYVLAVDVPGGSTRASASALVLLGVILASTALARLGPTLLASRLSAESKAP